MNVGSNTEISIADTLTIIQELMSTNIDIKSETIRVRPANSEVHRLVCNNEKIKRITGYNPKVNFREGLQKTIDWIMIPKNLKTYKTNIYNV